LKDFERSDPYQVPLAALSIFEATFKKERIYQPDDAGSRD